MITLRIEHKTTYRYSQPLRLGPHRLMLRPRESRDVHLMSSKVSMAPAATVAWAQDVFGNAFAIATFQSMAYNLSIDSVAELQLMATAWPVFDIAGAAFCFPFQYSNDEWTDLGALTTQQYMDPRGRLRGLGPVIRRQQSDGYFCVTKGHKRGRFSMDQLSQSRRRGRAVADRNSRSRLGILQGFRGPLC